MPVKLSAIEGLMIEKKDRNLNNPAGAFEIKCCGYNKAIDLQGSKQIELNREGLAIAMHKQERKTFGFGYEWENERAIIKTQWREMADAIIREEATLIETKK